MAAMMISSSTSTRRHQSSVSLSTPLHGGVVRVNRRRVLSLMPKNPSSPSPQICLMPKKSSPPSQICRGVKVNGTATTERLNVNGFVSPDWSGRFVEDSLVFRQCFAIRSYEVGPDKKVSVETLMSHLQETALNCIRVCVSIGDGFGTTLEMSRRDLIWVVSRSQLQVKNYPSWGDIIEVDTWVDTSGKNSMQWNWIARDIKKKFVIAQGTSIWAMMNKKTRRLSKIPNGVREEIQPYFSKTKTFEEEGTQKLKKLEDTTAPYISSNLSAQWKDLDANQHVNNIKYINWILESVPTDILQENEIADITLEYRRECMLLHTLQSLSSPQVCNVKDSTNEPPKICKSTSALEFNHLLRLQDNGLELLRARTNWRPKLTKKSYAN